MKIWTAEDPVEITQPGLRQVQVHPKIDFTFAAAMRSFLRADPDVIMVGEMRDHETAATGIEASLTGHLVFSTLHTNSAPETITRLLDMDIDPFNFADALLGILAQRLVRTLCTAVQGGLPPAGRSSATLVEEYGPEHWDKSGPLLGLDLPYRPSSRSTDAEGLSGVRQQRLQGPHGRPRAARRHRRAEARWSRSAAPIEELRKHAHRGRHDARCCRTRSRKCSAASSTTSRHGRSP